MSKEHNLDRRCFLSVAAGLAAGSLGTILRGQCTGDQNETGQFAQDFPGTNTSFGPLKLIDAGVLNVAYAEVGQSGWSSCSSSARLAL